jgi:TolB-like protein
MDFVRVTRQGDIAFSKDYLDLSPETPFRYVLTGTLVKQSQGTLVNARIIGVSSKAVVASAQGYLPAAVTESLVGSELNDGLPVLN